MSKIFVSAALFVLAAASAEAADWKIGDAVQGFNSGGWYDVTIVEIGTGNMAGYYKVHYAGHSNEQYLKAANIRARTAAAPPQAAALAPRDGKYVCMGYSGGPGQFRWYLNLAGGTYTQGTPNLASGRYSFDAKTQRVSFVSGPYAANNWIGIFSVEREGKTHKIVLRDKANEAKGPRVGEYANIVCTLSTDGNY